jgi:hypothetical protein
MLHLNIGFFAASTPLKTREVVCSLNNSRQNSIISLLICLFRYLRVPLLQHIWFSHKHTTYIIVPNSAHQNLHRLWSSLNFHIHHFSIPTLQHRIVPPIFVTKSKIQNFGHINEVGVKNVGAVLVIVKTIRVEFPSAKNYPSSLWSWLNWENVQSAGAGLA